MADLVCTLHRNGVHYLLLLHLTNAEGLLKLNLIS